MRKFQIFKEISSGGLSKEQLIDRLINTGVHFNKYAEELFTHSSFSPNPEVSKVSLIKVKQVELGLYKSSIYEEIIHKALSLGLVPCSLSLAAYLRLEYLDQAPGPYLTIASYKLENSESFPNGFYIRNLDNLLWLRGYRASNDYEWPTDHEFIFQC